nr:hypothetical protein Iba_chr07dCG8820 [Ipomoea batatas]
MYPPGNRFGHQSSSIIISFKWDPCEAGRPPMTSGIEARDHRVVTIATATIIDNSKYRSAYVYLQFLRGAPHIRLQEHYRLMQKNHKVVKSVCRNLLETRGEREKLHGLPTSLAALAVDVGIEQLAMAEIGKDGFTMMMV